MKIVLALLLAASLAGCTAPDEETDHPLLGVCPHWEPGTPQTLDLPTNVTAPFDMDGHALDRFWVEIREANGGQLRAFAGGQQRPLLDVEQGVSFPSVALEGRAGDVFVVGLSSPVQGTAPAPSVLELRLDGGAAQALVTPMYRVCGL